MHPASDFDRAVPDQIHILSMRAMRFQQHPLNPRFGTFDLLALRQGIGMLGKKWV